MNSPPSKKNKKPSRHKIVLLTFALSIFATENGLGRVLKPSATPIIFNNRFASDTKPIEGYLISHEQNTEPLNLNESFPSNVERFGLKTLRIQNEAIIEKYLYIVERLSLGTMTIAPPGRQRERKTFEQTVPSEQTDHLSFASKSSSLAKNWRKYAVPAKPDGRPMVAIVFDDLGIDKTKTHRAIQLPGPLTMSFLTYANQLKEQTKAARLAGHEIWMHVPMEPNKATIDPGPKVLLTGSGPQELIKNLTWNLDRFDKYVGINNHMGSRFTANLAEMHVVMEELNRRGLAFLDSVTSRQSQARLAASTMGVDFATRNIFIDHLDDPSIIRQQLYKIETLAHKKGYAIAIGHPRDNTLKSLKPWLNSLNDKGLMLVPVSALLNRSIGDAKR